MAACSSQRHDAPSPNALLFIADLTGAFLTAADLDGADLGGAILKVDWIFRRGDGPSPH